MTRDITNLSAALTADQSPAYERPADTHGAPDEILTSATPTPTPTMSVAAFLDHVARLLRGGLPRQVWLEASVVSVRAGRYGHTLELADPAAGQGASLRAFLPTATLLMVRREVGSAFDPALLAGMTTVLLAEPSFDPRWHLGARVVALARTATASLRRRLVEQTIATLKREDLWDRQRRLPVPRDVTRVAVVHPAGAAGWADVAARLAPWQSAGLLLVRSVQVPFEGERAAASLVRAITEAAGPGADGHGPDLVLLVRGGGAREGLAALDDEAVARAVCSCRVPVVAGTGHATDVTLADGCAWRRVDTPTAAAALVTSLVAAAARAASADRAAIVSAIREAISQADRRLAATADGLRAYLDRGLAAAQRALAASWSAVRVAAAGGRGRLDRLGDGATTLLGQVLVHAPAVLAEVGEGARRIAREVGERAWRLAGRRDDGGALMADVDARARAVLERHADALVRAREAVERDAGRGLVDATAALSGAALLVEAHDPRAVLARGFVLVSNGAGRVLTSRARAAGEARLVLTFGDGTLAAVPDGAG